MAQRKGSGSAPLQKAPRQKRAFLTRLFCWLGEHGVLCFRNPMFLKEIRSEVFGRRWFRRLLFLVPCLIFVTIAALEVPGFRPTAKISMINTVALTLTLLLVPAIAASSFAREIKQGNMDFLRGTLLRPSEMLAGKFLASLYSCSGILLAAACANAVLVTCGTHLQRNHPAHVVFAFSFCILCINLLFTTALSTFASVLTKRSVVGIVATYITLLSLYGGFPVALELARTWDEELLTATNPYIAIWFDESRLQASALSYAQVFLLLAAGGTICLWGAAGWVLKVRGARD